MGMVPLFESGFRIGDLIIQRRIGAGAFGVVYLARDELIGRDVAIKVLPTGDEKTEQQVLKEARAIGRLSHPHIATLFRVHSPREHGAWLYELEYIPGSSLAELLRGDGPLPREEVTRIAIAVAEALDHAHERGVVHGDIKPGNILVTQDGRIKLVDFGLARILGDVSLRLSESDQPGGTPLYMAPELILGEGARTASDVWSYGALLHHMLVGQPPFGGRGIGGLFHAILNEEPEPMTAGTPTHLRQVVELCLRKTPADRPSQFGIIQRWLQPSAATGEPLATVLAESPAPTRILHGHAPLLRRFLPAEQEQMKGRGQTVLVSGDAGIGKSALLRAMRRRARARGALWVDVSISPLHGLHGPLVLALEEALGIHKQGPPIFDVSTSTQRLLHELFGEEGKHAPSDQRGLFWATEQVLRALAGRGPLCLALDDAQNANAEDRLLLMHLAQYLPAAGILLVVACRTGGDEARSVPDELLGLTSLTHIPVTPLSNADSCALIEEALGTTRIAPEILKSVTRLAQGNPHLCTEISRHLLETGAVRVEQGQAVTGPVWESAELPRRLRDLTTLRLGALSEEHRQLLDVAAVDGVAFDAPALAAVTGDPNLTILRHLQQIQRRHRLVEATHDGYRFTSAAIRDVVYGDLAPEMRRALHDALARHLEVRAADGDTRATAARVGTHWEHAGDLDRARPFLREAVANALGRFESTRAVALAKRAGLVADALDPATVADCGELLLDLAAARGSGGDPAAGHALLDMIEAVIESGDPLHHRALVRKADLSYRHEGRAAVDTEALARASDELPLCGERAQARILLGTIAKYDHRLDDAERLFRDADEIVRELGIDSLHAVCLNELASIALRRGTPEIAAALYMDAARVAEHCGRRANAAASRVNAAIAAFDCGRTDGLVASLDQAVHLMAHEGALRHVGHARMVLAHVHWAEGNLDMAERNAADAAATLEELQFLPGLTAALRIRAELRGVAGDMAQADALFERARELVARSGNARIQRRIHSLAMLLHLWNGEPDAAEGTVSESIALLRDDAAERDAIALDLGEAVLYGLPASHAAEALAALEQGEDASARALIELMLAWARGDEQALPRLADEFRAVPLGYRRAALHAAARIVALEGIRARDGDAAAVESARDLLADVREIGHFWQELLVLNWLERHVPDGSWDAALRKCAQRHKPAARAMIDAPALAAGWWTP